MKIFFKIAAIAVSVLIIGAGVFYFSQKSAPENNLKLPEQKNMKISSSAFEDNQSVPKKYTCDGEDVNPPLEIQGAPAEAKSLALIVDDPDAPMGTWVHWTLWNINPAISVIEENSVPQGAVEGLNDFGKNSYGGPCPPSGVHRYHFKLYALDTTLELERSSKKQDLEKAMEGHILDWAELVGLYGR